MKQAEAGKYKCSHCEHICTHTYVLKIHESHLCKENPKSTAYVKSRSYTCKLCSKTFTHKRDQLNHEKFDCYQIHVCHKCGRAFPNIFDLNRHLKKDCSEEDAQRIRYISS